MRTLILLFALLPAFAFGQMEQESNNSFSEANSIELNTQVSAMIQVALDDDYFKFSISTPGIINLALTSVPGNLNLRVRLYDENQNEIYFETGNNGQNLSFEVTTCGTGDHYVFFEDRQNNGADPPSFNNEESYIFKVNFTELLPLDQCECENESFSQACDITPGDNISALIVPYFDNNPRTFDKDYYKFNVEEAGVIKFRFIQVPSNLNLSVFIFNDNQEEIYSEVGNTGQVFSLEVTSCGTGDHYIYISDRQNNGADAPAFNSTEQYVFKVDLEPLSVTDPCECANESFVQACSISAGEDISALITPYFDDNPRLFDKDYYQFDVSEPSILSFRLTQVPSNINIRVIIYDENQVEIYRETGNVGQRFSFDVSICEPGRHYAYITDNQNNGADAPEFNSEEPYGFRVELVPFASIEPNECNNNSFSGATAFGICDTMRALLSPGFSENSNDRDIDYFRINLDAGTSYRVVTNDIPAGLDLRLQIFDNNESSVLNEVSGTSNNAINFFFEPSTTGQYYIRIRERNGRSDSGQPYTLQVGCNQTTSTAPVTGLAATALYPNPAVSQFILDLSAYSITTGQLALLNTSGQRVLNQQVDLSQTTVDISNLPKGLYFVEFTSAERKMVGRIVRK